VPTDGLAPAVARSRHIQLTAAVDKSASYRELAGQLAALITGEPDLIANTANMAALVYHALPDLNWVGFYFSRGDELVLGPFQGKPACVRIGWGKGVCGAAASRGETIIVPDVHAFPGHIACDAASRSELVAPLVVQGRVVGVFDLDSPLLARFDDADRAGCERLVALLLAHQRDWPAALASSALR
jgi:L-methionine (R)-S-oxide reductase